MIKILDDTAIEKAKAEAERLSRTHKPHPRFEKEKYLLQAGKRDTLRQVVEWGEEDCPHHYVGEVQKRKRNCDDCWQELEQQAEEKG